MYSVNEEMKRYKTGVFFEEEGFVEGFKVEEGSLLLDAESRQGYFFLKGYDSLEEEMTWNRLWLVDHFDEQMKITAYIYTSDTPYIYLMKKSVSLDEVLQDSNRSAKEKIELLEQRGARVYHNCKDILLHEFQGRYLWLVIKAYNVEGADYKLEEITLEYPKQSFIDYFPAIYSQGDHFFERYIGIFQSLYLDLESAIDQMPLYLDVDTLPDHFLNYIGGWVGIDNNKNIFNKEQMRQMIREAISINGGKGTKATLEKVIKLYTGAKPIVVEYFKWTKLALTDSKRSLYQKLYGNEDNCFTVLINSKETRGAINKEKLTLLIKDYQPATAKGRLIILENCCRSDEYCYLGMNSFLAQSHVSRIDEKLYLEGNNLLRLS